MLGVGNDMKNRKIALLQSFRKSDVPAWVSLCQSSVKEYANANNWSYMFLDDQFFNFAPQWARDKVSANNLCTISDVCRLEWIKSELNNFDIVLWVDIDVLILNFSKIRINFSEDYGFAYETYFEDGRFFSGLNNSFMFFKKNSKLLDLYLELSYRSLQNTSSTEVIERTIIGPSLLRSLDIPAKNIIDGLDILNFGSLLEICNHPQHDIPSQFYKKNLKEIGGANLCLNERSFFVNDHRQKYDQILYAAANLLIQKYS